MNLRKHFWKMYYNSDFFEYVNSMLNKLKVRVLRLEELKLRKLNV
jgi:hypothetical protein